MIKSVLCLVIILFAASVSIAQADAPDAGELKKLLKEFLVGAGKNDAAMHDRMWADDLIYTRSAGQRIGKAELMKSARSAPAPKPGDPVTVYTAEDIKIQQYGGSAVVAFRLVATTTTKDKKSEVSSYLNTGMFIRRLGKWQAVAWQATAVPKS